MVLLVAQMLAQEPLYDEHLSEPTEPVSVDELVRDLRGSDTPDALYAARELRAQAHSHNRTIARGKPDSIRVLEARQQLAHIEERAAGPCIDFLDDSRLAAPCAGLLAELGLVDALPDLHVAAAQEELSCRNHRAIARAIGHLED